MPLSIWTQSSGFSLGTLSERQSVNIDFPVTTSTDITFSLISGSIPRGLRISGSKIIGTPFEVVRTTEYKFVIRAKNNQNEFSDRTFFITILGADEPQWITPPGLLPVGSNNAYFILDSSFIDFQLQISDTDTAAGQDVSFFIASGEGELPPGLILLPNGRITGFVQPLLAIPLESGDGSYDTDLFDKVAYDFGYRPNNGYDTYVFDSTIFDFYVPTGRPRKLNRNYEFIATVTDGDTVTKRKFRIYVVGDDFFRADNIITTAGEGTYTADATYVRAPIFTTPSNLGLRRANNYQTFKIDIYEGFTDLGPVIFSLSEINADINGICMREVGTDNSLGGYEIRLERSSGVPLEGQKITFNGEFAGATGEIYTITGVDILGGDTYRLTVSPALEVNIPNGTSIYIGDESILPPGMQFDAATAEVFGVVPYQPAITKNYKFTIKATRFGQVPEISVSRRIFTVGILGEVDSVMNWISPDDLGTIDAGYVSTLSVLANSTISTSAVLYTLEDGSLPPGLTLSLDGELVGKVNQAKKQNLYRSLWKNNRNYEIDDLVKINNVRAIKSVTRRRNTAFVVTNTDHDFKTNDLIEIVSDKLDFNYYSGISIEVNPIKLQSVTSIVGNQPYRVTFSIPTQKVPPLAPIFTKIKGTAISTFPAVYNNVTVKSTSGAGTGAVFRVEKGNNGITGTPTYIGVTTITLINPGIGYLPGDTIILSGLNLGGLDEVNDLTFETSTGLEFYYNINGNTNSNYNGRFFATASTVNSITLNFDSDPGTFGTGLISIETGPGTYEPQTQITPLNYFSYPNKGTSISMEIAQGNTYSAPTFYKCQVNHNSGLVFDVTKWEEYFFPESDKTLSVFDTNATTFDGIETSLDRKYTFTVMARDQLGYSAITKTFTLTVTVPNNLLYSNIFARPFLKIDQRTLFKDFINDSTIFDPRYIYRPSDPYFGIQNELKMLVYAGIETKAAVEYISAMGRNHKPKRFNFGDVKKAVAKVPGTNNVVYEVLYLEMKDPLEKGKNYLPSEIKYSATNVKITVDQNNDFYLGNQTLDSVHWKRPIPFNVTLDRNDLFAGDPGTAWRLPSSISLWRYRIKNMANTVSERNYLPLWMRSIQPGETQEINYVAAVPLCYCRPGTADEILLNIKNSQFDFKLLNYTIDRYIIDSVDGYYTDKYLVFRNDRTTIT